MLWQVKDLDENLITVKESSSQSSQDALDSVNGDLHDQQHKERYKENGMVNEKEYTGTKL